MHIKNNSNKMEQIKKLAEQLSNLTVLECYQLAKIMEQEYGIKPNTQIMGVNVSPQIVPKVEEKVSFNVLLKSTGINKLNVIRNIKDMTGKSLLEIKTLVESAPCNIKENISKDEADALVNSLKDLGADVEII